jgi:selenocysteine-specific elongation factor
MRQYILGTAGHIDHGKTSLVKALTGIDTDRLKEEKERGITIELGFAHLTLPGGKVLGIVDVPGHEKFVKNMVAGATGIDMVALVIAADEGVMPQTREHLEICQLLKVRQGIVVLTKIDMVDEEWLDLVREDVREYLSETFLGSAPIVEVSAITGQGIDNLVQVLDKVFQALPERDAGHIFRLPIDRVFTMHGFGTVITGTTVSGRIRIGDEVTLYPQGIDSKIRGIQAYNQEVTEVHAGLRTAVNLQGVEKAAIERGNVLAGKDSLKATRMIEVHLDLLPSAPRKLKNRAKVRFHTGTCEIISTVILLDRDELTPGQSCYAQIRLEAPTAVLRNDHYVIRSYSPVQTIGGGEILHALPVKRKRFSATALAEVKSLHSGDFSQVIEVFVSSARFSGVRQDDLPFLTNTTRKKLDGTLPALLSQKKITQYDREAGLLIHSSFLQKARNEILETIARYHTDYPLKLGLPKEELRSRTEGARNQKLFNYLMTQLSAEAAVAVEKDLIRLKAHRVTLAEDQEKTRQALEKLYLDSGLQPPYFKEIKDKYAGKTASEVIDVMVKEGVLIKVKEDLFFHKAALDSLQERLVEFLRANGEMTTQQFKDITGTSRKYTIPLIEHFDRAQLTVRVGDNRVLRKK